MDELAGEMLLYVLLKLFDFVYFFAFQLTLLLGDFFFSDAVDVLHLIFASLAATPTIAEVAVFEALAIAVKATLAVVAPRLGVGVLGQRSIVVEEFL